MSENIVVALITGAVSFPAAWYAARAAGRKSSADLMNAVDNRVTLLMQAQADRITALEGEVAKLKGELEQSRRAETRLHGLLRRVLTALHRHDPAAADRIRTDNADLSL